MLSEEKFHPILNLCFMPNYFIRWNNSVLQLQDEFRKAITNVLNGSQADIRYESFLLYLSLLAQITNTKVPPKPCDYRATGEEHETVWPLLT